MSAGRARSKQGTSGADAVKVHVRNIMKKLRARNRTEVAFLTQGMFQCAQEG